MGYSLVLDNRICQANGLFYAAGEGEIVASLLRKPNNGLLGIRSRRLGLFAGPLMQMFHKPEGDIAPNRPHIVGGDCFKNIVVRRE